MARLPEEYSDDSVAAERADAYDVARQDQEDAAQGKFKTPAEQLERIPGGPSADAAATNTVAKRHPKQSSGLNSDEPPQKRKPLAQRAAGTIASALIRRRKMVLIGGAGVSIISLLLSAFFAFLAPYKLIFMKENIDKVRMKRLAYMFDRRSDRFVRTLIAVEAAGKDGGGAERYFVARGWSSDHPFTQWYRDMKSNNFLEEMAEKKGYVYATDSQGRLTKISMNGQDLDFKDVMRGLNSPGGVNAAYFEAIDARVLEVFNSNREARIAFNNDVSEVTRRHNVVKRYVHRKWAYERLGITKWRFFEATREKADEKVRSRWNRATGAKQLNGSFIRCLLQGQCPPTQNLNDSRNKIEPSIDPDHEKALEDTEKEIADEDKPKTEKPAGEFAKKFTSKLIPLVNFVDIINTARAIEALLGDGGLQRLVAVTRASEYALSYFTLATITDNLKAGEKVAGEEVNAVMDMHNGIEQGDGYHEVVTKQSPVLAKSILPTVHAAGEDPNYAKVTPNMMVNSEDSRASNISEFYKGTFGRIIGPIADASNFPIIGDLLNAFNSVLGFITNIAVGGVSWVFGTITGTDLNSIFAGVIAKLVEFFGGAPACASEEVAGQLFNCEDGGGAVSAEAISQTVGGRPLSDGETSELNSRVALENATEAQSQSTWSKIASLENSNSLFARLITVSPANYQQLASAFSSGGETLSMLARMDTRALGWLGALMTPPAWAATSNENTYGVKMYGCSAAEIVNTPAFEDMSKVEVDARIAEFNRQLSEGKDPDLNGDGKPDCNMGSIDTQVANGLLCQLNDEDEACADVGIAGAGGGGDAGGGGAAGELVTGSDRELAQQILDNSRIHLIGTNAQADMQAMANGSVGPSGVKLHSKLLQIIATMGKNHTFNISSMIRPTDSDSAHSTGEAIDITGLDGNPIANSGLGRTPKDIALMKEISPLLPRPSGWGQIQCGTTVQLPRGIDQFGDTCNHLHLEINH